MPHRCQDLIRIFNQTFLTSHHTELIRGGDEPIYLPASDRRSRHQIVFGHDYFASALHEIAHWLVAGQARRLLEDFGYWYDPDGRDKASQLKFEQVEVQPQAIEWALADFYHTAPLAPQDFNYPQMDPPQQVTLCV